jgi:hypothetical protein
MTRREICEYCGKPIPNVKTEYGSKCNGVELTRHQYHAGFSMTDKIYMHKRCYQYAKYVTKIHEE